jgi:hypothetical protein
VTSATTREPRPGLPLLLALLVVAAAYSGVGEVGFMWDDHNLIEQNPQLHTLQAPWRTLTTPFWSDPLRVGVGHRYYRPAVSWSFSVDWALGDGSPLPFHLTNLLAHLLVCAAVFALARQAGARVVPAALATAVFGTLPRLTESVAWICGRTDVLAAFPVLVGLWLERQRPGDLRRRLLVALALLVGLLAKEVAATLAVMLAVDTLQRLARGTTRLRAELVAAAPVALALGVYAALRPASATSGFHAAALETQLGALGHFVTMVLLPFWPNPAIGLASRPEGWAVALGALAVPTLAWGVWRWGRRTPQVLALGVGATFALALVCVIALRVFTIASDRFLYLPLALLCAAVATVRLPAAWEPRALAVGALWLAVAGVVTHRQTALWGHEVEFWRVLVTQAAEGNSPPAMGLGDALLDRDRLDEALAAYVKSLDAGALQDTDPRQLALAVAHSRLGHDELALSQLEALMRDHPEWKRAWYDHALFEARAERFDLAHRDLTQLEARFPGGPSLGELRALIEGAEAVLTRSGATTAERAHALDTLGATRRAQRLYEGLLDDPAQATLAAQWLVLKAERPVAEAALQRLGDAPGARAVFEERWPPDEHATKP